MIHTARSHQGDLSDFLRRFRYQRELTAKLDALPNAQFSQETINEIILWKVNRYARLSDDVRKALYALRALKPLEHRSGEQVLLQLLACTGIDLPMASTILRFQAADVFQIIDRRAYRAVFGVANPFVERPVPN